MNKKLMAVAVAGALAAPAVAFAQASTVQIYGNIIMNYNYLDQGNHRIKVDQFNNHDSGIGVKGEEKIGGGNSVWFQCESTFDVSGTSSAAGTAGFCGRNSAVGLKGGFGNVYAGNWDTSMKIAMGGFRPFSTSGAFGMGAHLWNTSGSNIANPVTTTVASPVIGGATGTLTSTSGGTSSAFSFTRRQTNLLSYAIPKINGFDAGISYSAINESTATTTAATNTKPRLWSLGATYVNGPLALGLGYERHRNYNPAASVTYGGGTDRALNLAAAYTIAGKYKISVIHTRQDYETNTTTARSDLDNRNWGIYGDLALSGPHKVRLGYTKAGDTKGNSTATVGSLIGNPLGDTGSKTYAIQYAYAASKRTEFNLGYAKLDNDSRAKYTLQSLGTGTLGQDQNAWVMGVKHTF